MVEPLELQGPQPPRPPQPPTPPEPPVPPLPPDPPTPPDAPLPPMDPPADIGPMLGPMWHGPSEELIGVLAIAFFLTVIALAIGIPLVRALARKWDRQAAVPAPTGDVASRLDRIEQAVDAIAIEVERISEGQRYTNQAIAELRALPPSDPAEALERRLAERTAARDRLG